MNPKISLSLSCTPAALTTPVPRSATLAHSTRFAGIDHENNPHPRCPIAILLDTSGSMAGEPITEVQRGLRQMLRDIAADDLASLRVEPSIYTFGGTVCNISPFGTPIDVAAADLPPLVAGGETPLGGAVRQAVADIEARCRLYQANAVPGYKPWVCILTDGVATDVGWREAARELRERAARKSWNVFVVAIGDRAELSNLREFSVQPPLRLANLHFAEFFVWLTRSIQTVSGSIPSGPKVTLAPTSEWTVNP